MTTEEAGNTPRCAVGWLARRSWLFGTTPLSHVALPVVANDDEDDDDEEEEEAGGKGRGTAKTGDAVVLLLLVAVAGAAVWAWAWWWSGASVSMLVRMSEAQALASSASAASRVHATPVRATTVKTRGSRDSRTAAPASDMSFAGSSSMERGRSVP